MKLILPILTAIQVDKFVDEHAGTFVTSLIAHGFSGEPEVLLKTAKRMLHAMLTQYLTPDGRGAIEVETFHGTAKLVRRV